MYRVYNVSLSELRPEFETTVNFEIIILLSFIILQGACKNGTCLFRVCFWVKLKNCDPWTRDVTTLILGWAWEEHIPILPHSIIFSLIISFSSPIWFSAHWQLQKSSLRGQGTEAIWVEFAHFVSYHLAWYPNPNCNPYPNPYPYPKLGKCRLFHKMCDSTYLVVLRG